MEKPWGEFPTQLSNAGEVELNRQKSLFIVKNNKVVQQELSFRGIHRKLACVHTGHPSLNSKSGVYYVTSMCISETQRQVKTEWRERVQANLAFYTQG